MTSSADDSAPSTPPVQARPRWALPLAFAAGGVLTALALFVAVQFGALDAFANTPPMPSALSDPRIDRLLGLLASERDCDSDCLADLKTRADKSEALQQALGALQESADAARQRVAALEGEKQGIERKLAELGEAQQQQTQRTGGLEEEKRVLTEQLVAKEAELDGARKQQSQRAVELEAEKQALTQELGRKLTEAEAARQQQEQRAGNLEGEKVALTEQVAKKQAELENAREEQAQRVAKLEEEKQALAQELGRKLAEMEAARKQQEQRAGGLEGEKAALQQRLAALERRLAEASANPAGAANTKAANAASRPVPKAKELPPPAPVASLNDWTVHAMTQGTIVVSAPGHRFTALAVGEELNGVKITRIDAAQGVAETSAGPLNYRR